MGLFVFLFLILFNPFESNEGADIGTREALVYVGYGFITFLINFIYELLIPRLFRFRKKDSMSFRHLVLMTLGLYFCIGSANAVYYHIISHQPFCVKAILAFQGYTLLIGVFPTIFFTIVEQNMQLKKQLEAAQAINTGIRIYSAATVPIKST